MVSTRAELEVETRQRRAVSTREVSDDEGQGNPIFGKFPLCGNLSAADLGSAPLSRILVPVLIGLTPVLVAGCRSGSESATGG